MAEARLAELVHPKLDVGPGLSSRRVEHCAARRERGSALDQYLVQMYQGIACYNLFCLQLHSPWHVMGDLPALALPGDKEVTAQIEGPTVIARSGRREKDGVFRIVSCCASPAVEYVSERTPLEDWAGRSTRP